MSRLCLSVALLGGCSLPLATGTALPATTVGKDRVGLTLYEETPVLDLVVDRAETATAIDSSIDVEALGSGVGLLAFGLRDGTDVEGGLHLAMHYFVAPVPVGGTIGIRQHVVGVQGHLAADEQQALEILEANSLRIASARLRRVLGIDVLAFHRGLPTS